MEQQCSKQKGNKAAEQKIVDERAARELAKQREAARLLQIETDRLAQIETDKIEAKAEKVRTIAGLPTLLEQCHY